MLQLHSAKGTEVRSCHSKDLWEGAAGKRQDWVYFANLLLNCSEANNCFKELCRTQNQISGAAPSRAEQQRNPAVRRGCARWAQGCRVRMLGLHCSPRAWPLLWVGPERDQGQQTAPVKGSSTGQHGEGIPAGSPWAGTRAALCSVWQWPPHPLEPSTAPAAALPAHLALFPASVQLKYLISFGISVFRVVFFFSILLFSFLFAFGSFLPFCCCLFVLLFIICCFFFLLRKQTVMY